MKHSDSISTIAKALVAAQGEIKPVVKDATNPHFKNRYASLDALAEAVRPVLVKNKLALVQGSTLPTTDETGALVGITVETMLLHEGGEWLSNAVALPLDKATAQGVGSAISYGRRYGLSSLLALTTDEDDDGAKASEPRARSNGNGSARSNKPAAEKVMPFGKSKGKKLGELDDADLAGALKWCKEGDKTEKFKDLIAALEEVNASRAGGGVGEDAAFPAALEDADDDLPF